jgi:hypothetical protein
VKGAAAGDRGRTPHPIGAAARRHNYLKQTGRPHLTPAQRRRALQKVRRINL